MSYSARDVVYTALLDRSVRADSWDAEDHRDPLVRSTDVGGIGTEMHFLDALDRSESPSEETVRRTLRAATALGMVSHRSGSQSYKLAHSRLRTSGRGTLSPSTPDPDHSDVTARDLAWLGIIRVSIRTGVDGESFRRSDLEEELAEEEAVEAPSGETVRRTLKGARELGIIEDGPSRGRYHLAGVEPAESDSGSHSEESEPAEVEPDGGSEETLEDHRAGAEYVGPAEGRGHLRYEVAESEREVIIEHHQPGWSVVHGEEHLTEDAVEAINRERGMRVDSDD